MPAVLITTSGTGSRLGNLTKYTNKSLVPVGDKYALAHIIEHYPEDTKFIITIGYLGHLVREFCSLAYPTRNIQFVEVNVYEGPGSSLLYSMLQAMPCLQEPFIFHCCDTILTEPMQFETKNTVVVVKDVDFESYSSICGTDENVQSFHKKGFAENNFCYTGVAYYYDYKSFWQSAKSIYETDPMNQSLSDVHCIQAMIASGISFSYKELHSFYDTGNLIKYKQCLEHFHTNFDVLAKPNESLCFFPDKVIKFQADKQLNKKRHLRAVFLQPNVPAILGATDHFLSMEFIPGTLLAESKSYGDVRELLEWAEATLWKKKTISSIFKNECESFYLTKTHTRLSQLDLQDESINVNGEEVGTIAELLSKIDIEFLKTDTFAQFHGDFILDNIIKRKDGSFCLLDWRHEFGSQLYHGDIYYDLAKLRHNIIFNHKNILQNLFQVEKEKSGVFVDIKCNYFLMKQLEDLDSFLEKYNYNKKKVTILTAIIWLNMAPLYEGKLREFLFYFGKWNLYLAMSPVRP